MPYKVGQLRLLERPENTENTIWSKTQHCVVGDVSVCLCMCVCVCGGGFSAWWEFGLSIWTSDRKEGQILFPVKVMGRLQRARASLSDPHLQTHSAKHINCTQQFRNAYGLCINSRKEPDINWAIFSPNIYELFKIVFSNLCSWCVNVETFNDLLLFNF